MQTQTRSTIPTNDDFATEVRSDRLAVLWKVTLTGSAGLLWVLLTVATLHKTDYTVWIIALALLSLGCLFTRYFLRGSRFQPAAWSYALGGITAGACPLLSGGPQAVEIIPFVFPLVIFMVGLLLAPSRTLILVVVCALVVVFAPMIGAGRWLFPGGHQLFAIGLTVIGALLAAQVTGELYQVTEWALMNYQRERKTNDALFENRQLLERELLRSQALSEELRKTNAQLEVARAAAEEAKHFRGQFLANMSHELRTPLNAIIGFSETMLKFPAMYDGVTLPKTYENDLGQIYSSGRQLLNLINDILDLSKVDAGKLEVFTARTELTPITEFVLATAAGLVGSKPVRLERDLPPDLPDVLADESRLRQVLMNLYSNAVKFTDSGSITLIVRSVDEGVRISVKDTGCGIDPSQHEAIFEEFKQTDAGRRDPRAGAGLGLAIARHLLKLMGGSVSVESTPGQGATFHVLLQAYRPPTEAADKPDLEKVAT